MRSLLLFSLTACATLDAAQLSEPCRVTYNACLNTCPSADSRARRPAENPHGPQANYDTTNRLMTDVASCTQKCNDEAKACERPPPSP